MKIIKGKRSPGGALVDIKVDDDLYEDLLKLHWLVTNWGYAVHYTTYKRKKISVAMHKLVNQTPDGFQTDHIDGDRLNNTRANLRTVTQQQNKWNRGLESTNSSGYKGVQKHGASKKWQAKISVNNKPIHLGVFENKEAAALAYNEAATKYFGDFAKLNIIDYLEENK